MTHDVFVSYTKKDKVVADSIVATLEGNDIRCYYAPRDIKPGEDWGKAISDAIKGCKIFLLVFSGSSNKSRRVLDELNLAISTEKITLPFRIENLEPSDAMMLHLTSRHWLDAYDPSWEKHLSKLTGIVASNLDKPVIQSEFIIPTVTKIKKTYLYLGAGLAVVAVVAGLILAFSKNPSEPDDGQEAAVPEQEITSTYTIAPTEVSTSTPTLTETPPPPVAGGFQDFITTDITISLPDDWITIDMDKEGMDAIMTLLEDVDPDLAANISAMVSAEEMQEMGEFWAMDETGLATANLMVQTLPYNVGTDIFCEMMPEAYKEMGMVVSESQCGLTINQLDSAWFLVEIRVGTVSMKQYQYMYIRESDMWILTLGTEASGWDTYQPTFVTIAESFRVND